MRINIVSVISILGQGRNPRAAELKWHFLLFHVAFLPGLVAILSEGCISSLETHIPVKTVLEMVLSC